MQAVLAIDVGSSAVRAALYDVRARELPGTAVRHAFTTRVEADAEALLTVIERAITDAAGGANVAIAGVGVSTFWHGLVAADGDGRPLSPLYLWSDTRSGTAAEDLGRRLDIDAVLQRTGCPIHSSYWPAKLAWLRGERPELWRGHVRWLSLGDLLYQRLFGTVATSLSMASGTGLFRLDRPEWDRALCDAVGIEPSSLPAIGESERGLRPPYALMWPALAGVPWFHAAGDGALANLGSGCLKSMRRSVTIGTSAAVRVMHRAPARQPVPRGLWRYRLDAKRVVTGGALSSGGNVRDWIVDLLGIDNARLEDALRTATPASHGLSALPYLAGERSPGYSARAAAAVRGLSLATNAIDIARAVIESVTVDLARVNRLLDAAAPRPQALVASGGALLGSNAWMQLVADATGSAVLASKTREASSRGAALFVLERLGLADPADLDPGKSRILRPRREASRALAAAAERQAALYSELLMNWT